ncbi:MAG: hypothetical protein JSS30_03835 [Verrucomicrobia bacterium]|nr:hypothetical protein [Verrucomicrobiota bacterium]
MQNFKKWSKALIPLSLITFAGGFAESEIADNCCPTNNCCPPTCCKPCCVPQPKKCIDCECYNPHYYDLQCDWGIFVTADFLYWYARETNLEYAYDQQFFPQPTQTAGACARSYGYNTKHHYLKTEWKPGVRVGLGMNSDCDGWDLFLNWTYLDNNVHGRTTRPTPDTLNLCRQTGVFLVQPWADGNNSFVNGFVAGNPSYPVISAKWSLIFNQIDFEFGRKFWVSKCMTIRPYTGLRGAWTHTNFHVTAELADPNVVTFVAQDVVVTQGPTFNANNNRFKNRFWGMGILGGLQPEFMLGDWCGYGMFSLYGNVEGALIWGKYKGRNQIQFVSDVAQTIGGVNADIRRSAFPLERDGFSRMQGILDLGIGMRWEQHWCCDRFSTAIDIGWEHHYWFDFGFYHRPGISITEDTRGNFPTASPILSFPGSSDNFVSNLGLGGFVLRFRFDF